MVLSLRERLDAEKAKKEAEARAAVAPKIPTGAVAPSTPARIAAQAPPPQKPVGRLAALLKKSTVPAGPAKVTVPAPPKPVIGGASVPAKATVPEPPPPPVADLADADLASFRAQLKYLEENIEQKELIGQVVRNIMQMWRRNPQFSSSISDADEDIVARGFMRAFNVAARRKTEDQGKKTAKKATISELDELMKGAGFNPGGDPLGKMFGG